MAVCTIKKAHGSKVICVCVTYSEAVEWAEAHDYQYVDGGVSYRIHVEDRYY